MSGLDAGGGPDLDELFDALASRRRRLLVALTEAFDGRASVDRLVDELELAGGEERTTIRLVHVDLPKLAEAGLVAYDDRAGVARYVGHSLVEDALDRLEELTAPTGN